MKYEITTEDQKIMERDMQTDRTLKHIRNLSFYKFTVGDILVREDKYTKYDATGGYEWKVRMADNNLAYKYVYVFENELSVGYIRRLSVNGRKFVERPICITEFDPDQTRFALDPEYADHMLLANEDEEFDTKSRYAEAKKKREQIHRKNKKIAVPIPDEAAAIAWMNTLKVGDQIWYGYSIGNIYKDVHYVTEINTQAPLLPAVSKPTNPSGYGYNSYQPTFVPHIKISTQQVVTNGYSSALHANILPRYYVFMQRPTFFDEVIN